MDFDKMKEKVNNMSPDELEETIRETMVESGIDVRDEPCRFVLEEMKVEDCEIDVDKI